MIYVSNDGHVTDIFLFVHHGTDFVYGEVHLKRKRDFINKNINAINIKGTLLRIVASELSYHI